MHLSAILKYWSSLLYLIVQKLHTVLHSEVSVVGYHYRVMVVDVTFLIRIILCGDRPRPDEAIMHAHHASFQV